MPDHEQIFEKDEISILARAPTTVEAFQNPRRLEDPRAALPTVGGVQLAHAREEQRPNHPGDEAVQMQPLGRQQDQLSPGKEVD